MKHPGQSMYGELMAASSGSAGGQCQCALQDACRVSVSGEEMAASAMACVC